MSEETGTKPNKETRVEEEAEARASHRADRPPTAGEERAAPDAPSRATEKGYEEMAERGANVKGEGQIP